MLKYLSLVNNGSLEITLSLSFEIIPDEQEQ